MPPVIPTAGRARTISIGFTPGIFRPYFKVEITDKNGTTTTYQAGLTDRVILAEIIGRVNAIKEATIVLPNNDGYWSNKFSGGESIKIYADYTGVLDSTSKRFDGRLDEYRFALDGNGQVLLELHCRQKPELQDKTVIATFTNVDAGTALQTLISDNFSGVITTTDVGTIGTTITTDIIQQTGVGAITSICELIDYQWHIDENGSLQVFAKGSRPNQTERAGMGTNVVGASSAGLDYKDVRNRVFVYGKTSETNSDVFYLATRQDAASQSRLWVKDEVVNDNNVDSNAQAATLALKKIRTVPERRGVIQCAGGLLTLQAGQSIDVQLPYMEMQGQFVVGEYRHSWSSSGLNTFVSVSTTQENVADLFQERIRKERELRDIRNQNSMLDSVVFKFEDSTDTSSLANLEISDNALRIVSGFSTGNWVSVTKQLPATASSVEVRVDGEDLDACTYGVSLDGGVTFTSATPKTVVTGLSGRQLVLRVTLNSDTNNPLPILNAVSAMAK